jgi:hypothetical protein
LASTIILNYSKLIEEYDRALVEQLRSLELGQDFLASWVPDSNTVRSVLNLIDVVHSAGITSIDIQFNNSQLIPDDEKILLESLSNCISASFGKYLHGIVLTIKGIANPRWDLLNYTIQSEKIPKVTLQEPSVANQVADQENYIRPAKVNAFDRSINFQDELPLDSESSFFVGSDGMKLFLKITGTIPFIEKACHAGVKDEQNKAYWDLLCENLQGSSLIEGVEHGVLKMVHTLAELGVVCPGPGIFLPSNAGEPFVGMQNLVLKLYSNYCKKNRFEPVLNEFDPPPKNKWIALSHDEKAYQVKQSIEKFASSGVKDKISLTFERIESDLDGYPIRIFVDFSNLESINRSNTARELEIYLKNNLEPKLQIYAIEVKDKNKIRRLR